MHGDVILETVSPEKRVVIAPHAVEQPARDRKGEESSHGSKQFIEGIGYLKGNHEQRKREAEDGIGKTFYTRHVLASPGESFFAADPPLQ